MLVPSVSIQNRHGVAMLIDEEDLGLLTQHKAGHWCFAIDRHGYANITHRKELGGDGRTPVGFHRLILDFPVEMDVDHISQDSLDNRKENLRICTQSQNQKSFPGRGASKFKGVSRNGKKWCAKMPINGRQAHLGTFDTEEKAALAYDAAVKRLGCEFRTLNFPDEVPINA